MKEERGKFDFTFAHVFSVVMELDASDVLQEHWINQRRYVESLIIVWLDVKIDPIDSQAVAIKQLCRPLVVR